MKWLLNTTVRLVFLLAFVGIAVLGIPAVSNMYNFAPGAVSNIPWCREIYSSATSKTFILSQREDRNTCFWSKVRLGG